MPSLDYSLISRRESRAKAEMQKYGLPTELDEQGYAYIGKKSCASLSHACELNAEDLLGDISLSKLAGEQVRMHNEKGKYVLLLLDAAYVSVPTMAISLGQRYTFDLSSQIMKFLHRRLVDVSRSRSVTALPHQTELLFHPRAEENVPVLSDEVKEHFHALIDKQLMSAVSEQEKRELTRLEQVVGQHESEDLDARRLEKHWSERFDSAIGSLERINERLEKLLQAEK